MSDIYQDIWHADQLNNGIPAHAMHDPVDESKGYVRVDEQGTGIDHKLFPEVSIPARKQASYDLCSKLFNNYSLDQHRHEINTAEEEHEIFTFIDAMADSETMRLARTYIEHQSGRSFGASQWHNLIHEIWFKQYDQGRNRDLSGFEHVIVGEQKGSKLGGYHFWYKYHLDEEGLLLDNSDDILYYGTRYRGQGAQSGSLVADVVTLSYRWQAYDYENRRRIPLTKPIGGFWVGCSIEGLMAIGTTRFVPEARSPKEAVINGNKYALRLYRGPTGRSMRTFYPEFLGQVESDTGNLPRDGHIEAPPEESRQLSPIKILAALINPEGNDVGDEMVLVINESREAYPINGWTLRDKNNRSLQLSGSINPFSVSSIRLSGSDVQLSNKGGSLTLAGSNERIVNEVRWSKSQAKASEGQLLYFR